jgi:ankyrin repeat protein
MKQEKTSVRLAVTTALLLCFSCTIDPSQSEEERQHITEFERTLEENPALIDAPGGPQGTIPLHFAVVNNYMSLVRWLLAHGADVNARDSSGEAPLHEAIISDRTPRHKFVSTLLENGADINALNNNGDTPLHRAANFGETTVANLLLSYGADVNTRAKPGETPLHYAVFEAIPEEGDRSNS